MSTVKVAGLLPEHPLHSVGYSQGSYFLITRNGLKTRVAVPLSLLTGPKEKVREYARERFRQMLRNEWNVAETDALILAIDATTYS